MKVTSITFNEPFGYGVTIIDDLLKNGIMNNYIFENGYIIIKMNIDNPFDCLYRKYWESTYLQRSLECLSHFKSKTEFKMQISVNEAMMYIQNATPPRLKHLIKTIKSTNDLIKTLNEFLIVESDMLITYHSIFKSVMHFNEFETSNDDDVDNNGSCANNKINSIIKLIKNKNINKPLLLFEYSNNNTFVNNIIMKKEPMIDCGYFSILNYFINDKNINNFTFDIFKSFHITNVQHYKDKGLYMITLVNDCDLSNQVIEYIHNSYKYLL